MLLLLQFEMLDKNNEQALLSHYFNKKLIKNRKLNMFGKAITIIDLINKDKEHVHTLMELDLSHNAITQLANISQFRELQILNISHNKIEEQTELQKLFMLPHLHTLYIKNNPLLKTTPSIAQLRILLGFNTDIVFMSSQVEQKINKLVSQTSLFHRYSHYYQKIKLDYEFFKEKAGLSNYASSNGSSLPKIKRLFQQNPYADKTLRKSIIYKLDPSLFQKPEDLILQLDKHNKNAKKKVSEILIQINQVFSQLSSIKVQKFQTNIIVKSVKINNQLSQNSKHLRQKQNIKHVISSMKLSPNKSLSMEKSYVRKQKSTFDADMQSSTIKLTDFQNQFTNMLTRIHPSFSLLHSPLPSLKSHEKDLLIEQLLNTLKDSIKSNIKLKNVQSENNQLKEQIKNLKKHLADITIQVTQHTKNLNDRIKELQSEYEQQLGKAQLLQMESKRRLLENDLQREVIEKFKEQTKVKNNQNQSLLKDIQQYEKISQLRSNTIKKRHLNILKHRAFHYAKIKQLRIHNQNSHINFLKQQVLYRLKMNQFLQFYQRKIQTKFQSRHLKDLLSKNHHLIKKRQSQKQLGVSLKLLRVKSFLQKLKNLKQQEKLLSFHSQKLVSKYRSLQISYFLKSINSSISTQLSQKQQKRAKKHKRSFFLRSIFTSWNNYVHQLKQNQQKCQKDYSQKMKSIGIKDFVGTMLYEITFNSKTMALHNFLPNFRKIKGYLTFTNKLSQILLKRSINIGKVRLQKKNHYLQLFISVMKDRILKKGLRKERNKELKKIQQKQQQIQQYNILEKKKQSKKIFAKQMASMAQKLRLKILQRFISTSALERKVNTQYMTRFISNIRSYYIQHLRINKKISQVESYRFAMYKCRKVFAVLGRIQDFKNNQKKKQRVLQMKIFYNWKIMFNQHSLIIFREKYHQLQTEVDSLKEKHLKSQQQREILFKKLEQKDKLYQQCIKKSEQLTFLLESKEIKYQNLKSIFNDTLQLNQQYKQQKYDPLTEQATITKTPPSKNKFLKCMQQQIRKDLTLQMDKHQNNKDRFLYEKGRNLQFKQKLYNNQNRQQLQQKTQRFSFISSFKRF